MANEYDQAGISLPIKLDSTSNGEFVPIQLEQPQHLANQLAHQKTTVGSKKLNLSRRLFLKSSCGIASTLLAFNSAFAQHGLTGGFYQISADSAVEPALAEHEINGQEFIFDVQGHFVNPHGDWLTKLPESAQPLSFMPKARCHLAQQPGNRHYLKCLGPDEFIKDVFMDSDTDMMVLSFVPSAADREPLTIQEADATRQIIEKMQGNHRLLLHGRVNPNQPGDLQSMDALAEVWRVSAFKTYTQFGPNDIGKVANMYPDMNFIVYHSGFDPAHKEQAYDPANESRGVDTLIDSVLKHQVKPNSNIFAELGSTWRFLMRDPNQAAHVLGELIHYIGENNVLWGTDSIWYGSPQDQIQAFRTFQISDDFQAKYGYQAISKKVKAKIFGLNATKPYQISAAELTKFLAKDQIAINKQNYLNNPQPHFKTYGPKTHREFLNLMSWS